MSNYNTTANIDEPVLNKIFLYTLPLIFTTSYQKAAANIL